VAAVEAIHAGDTGSLAGMLGEHPELATAALGTEDNADRTGMTRPLLHVVTDWPGHFPSGPAVVNVLVGAGADVNARFTGPHNETPVHWLPAATTSAIARPGRRRSDNPRSGHGRLSRSVP
jgi:hypothetical protein